MLKTEVFVWLTVNCNASGQLLLISVRIASLSYSFDHGMERFNLKHREWSHRRRNKL